jgi:hypothetical protein
MSFIQYLIAGGLGFGVAKLLDSSKSKKTTDSNNTYEVFTMSDDFDKSSMSFYTFEDAQKMYDKILKSKKVKYKDIVEFDEAERKLFEQWKEEGNIGKEGYPKLSDSSRIQRLVLYINNDAILEYEI